MKKNKRSRMEIGYCHFIKHHHNVPIECVPEWLIMTYWRFYRDQRNLMDERDKHFDGNGYDDEQGQHWALIVPDVLDVVIEQEYYQQLYNAIAQLPPIQRRRIVKYYFLGYSKRRIAKEEGVSEPPVGRSIEKGLRRLARLMAN